ncbi:MAG: glycosyltransferase family 4 protein [Patescibacteria group bacterium]
MPYRIAHITPVYPPYAGGIGVVAKNMAGGLAGRRWQVETFTPTLDNSTQPPLKLRGGEGGVMDNKITYLKPWLHVGNAALVPQLRKLEGYDIIHLHYPFFGGAEFVLLGIIFQRFNSAFFSDKATRDVPRKSAFILQYHHDADAKGLKGMMFKLYDRIVLPRLITRADRVIVSAMDYAQHSRIAKYISDKFVEIPFGVDAKRFEPLGSHSERSEESPVHTGTPLAFARDPSPDSRGQDDKSVIVLFVGSLDRAHWFKGLEVLLHAFAILKQENEQNRLKSTHLNPTLNTTSQLRHSSQRLRRLNRGNPACAGRREGLNLKCLVIGEGNLKEKYKKMAQDLGIQDQVQFFGNVSQTQLPDYYRNADLFVFPSVSRAEAFGLVALEAMASGLPVIVSDLPGVRTLVEEGINGFKVPVNDPRALARRIQDLIEDKSLRGSMGQKSREKVLEGYTWDKAIDKIERVYLDMLVNKP